MVRGYAAARSRVYLSHRALLSNTNRSPSRSRRGAARIRRLTLALALASAGDVGLILNQGGEANGSRPGLDPVVATTAGPGAASKNLVAERVARWRGGVRLSGEAIRSWLVATRLVRRLPPALSRFP